MFVEVAVNLPHVYGTFDYRVPEDLEPVITPGQLITVPFGSRVAQGIITEVRDRTDVAETKSIEALLDHIPVITNAQLELARWMAGTYKATLIDCLNLMLPPGLSQQTDSSYQLVLMDAAVSSEIQERILKLLHRRGELRGRQLSRALPHQRWKKAMDTLVRRGVVKRSAVLDPPSVRAVYQRTARLALTPTAAGARVREIGQAGSAAYERRVCMIKTLIAEGEPLEAQWLYAECGGSLSDLRILEDHDLIILSDAEV